MEAACCSWEGDISRTGQPRFITAMNLLKQLHNNSPGPISGKSPGCLIPWSERGFLQRKSM